MPPVVEGCQIANPVPETVIVVVIVINATVLDPETFEPVVADHSGVFDVRSNTVLSVYVIELLIRFTAASCRP